MRLPVYKYRGLPLKLLMVLIILCSYYKPSDNFNLSPGSNASFFSGASESSMVDGVGSMMPPEIDYIIIPLKNAGRLLMIEAVIDGQTGNLIFDTGATGLVLNRTYFRKYPKMESQVSTGITGSVVDVERINLGNLNLSGLIYKNIPGSLADLGHIENRRGVKVLGLFGFDLIKDFEIIIDARNNELQLQRIDARGNRVSGKIPVFQSDYSQKFDVSKNIVFVTASIGGKLLKFCLDTGAETNAISSHASKAVLSTISVDRKSNLRGTGTTSVEVLFGIMNDFSFGGRQLKNMETIITHMDALNEAYGVQIDGMLGYNFLSNGAICINFVKRQLGIRFINKE
jgi:predicted aspartyl protease